MLPATKAIPKELLPIYDRPLIEHVVKEAIDNEIQLTDALFELQVRVGLNAALTDASVYDCGNKLGILGANLAICMRVPK